MFDKAVVCTDLAPGSDELVACAEALYALGLRRVILAHIVDVFGGETGRESSLTDSFRRQAAALEAIGLSVQVDASVGHPSYSIEEIAERHSADLIVVGVHDKGLHETAFSGSVSSDLLHISTHPVLLAPLGSFSTGRAHETLLRHVLFPTDLSEDTQRARSILEALAPRGLERVTLMHVVDREHEERHRRRRRSNREGLLEIRDLERRLTVLGAQQTSVRLAYGVATRQVLQEADSGEYSLVLMGAHHDMSVAVARGSVSGEMLRAARVPMLIAPTARHAPSAQASGG